MVMMCEEGSVLIYAFECSHSLQKVDLDVDIDVFVRAIREPS